METIRKLTHTNRASLQVKISSLAAEAIIIKKKEIKWKEKARRARDRQKVNEANGSSWTYHHLRYHRLAVVRPETRAASLAYAFLRGRPYETIEYNPDQLNIWGGPSGWIKLWNRVIDIAFKHRQTPEDLAKNKEQIRSEVLAWRDAGLAAIDT